MKLKWFFRYTNSDDYNPGVCQSGVVRNGRGATRTIISTDCYTGPGKIHNGIAWIVLHEVIVMAHNLWVTHNESYLMNFISIISRWCMPLDFITSIKDQIVIILSLLTKAKWQVIVTMLLNLKSRIQTNENLTVCEKFRMLRKLYLILRIRRQVHHALWWQQGRMSQISRHAIYDIETVWLGNSKKQTIKPSRHWNFEKNLRTTEQDISNRLQTSVQTSRRRLQTSSPDVVQTSSPDVRPWQY